jgi:uncharacterized membrane protein
MILIELAISYTHKARKMLWKLFLKKIDFPEPFKHTHPPVQEISELDSKPSSIGQRAADWVYNNVGSWRFIAVQSVLIALWIMLNANTYINPWEPCPFIFMDLIFSVQAAYTASIIMIRQNRQDSLKPHKRLPYES